MFVICSNQGRWLCVQRFLLIMMFMSMPCLLSLRLEQRYFSMKVFPAWFRKQLKLCCLDACYLGFPVRCESLVCLSSKQLNASLSLLKAPKGSVLSLSSSGIAGADLSSSRKARAPAKFCAPSAGAEPCTETAFAELWAKRFHGRVTCASFCFPFPSLSHRVSPDHRMGNLLRNRRFTVPPASLPPPSLLFLPGGVAVVLLAPLTCQALLTCTVLGHHLIGSAKNPWGRNHFPSANDDADRGSQSHGHTEERGKAGS